MTETIETIAPATGSGTDEYGTDAAGHMYARGYGERHGWTHGGVPRVRVTRGGWRLVCPEDRGWRGIVAAHPGISLYAYLAGRERGLSHEEAMEREIRRIAEATAQVREVAS